MMMQFGVASPAALIPVSPFGSPAFPDGTGTGFVGRGARRDDVPADAPCRAPPLHREQHRGRGGEPEPSRQQLTKATAVIGSERLPPISPNPSAPSLALRCGFLGHHWYLRFAPSTQLPTCVHGCCTPARSLLLTRFFTRALGATCRLPIYATEWTYEHTLEHSKPHRIQGANSKAAHDGRRQLLRTTPTELYQAKRYCRTDRRRLRTPHCDDRSPRWIDLNLSGSNTSCREPMPGEN